MSQKLRFTSILVRSRACFLCLSAIACISRLLIRSQSRIVFISGSTGDMIEQIVVCDIIAKTNPFLDILIVCSLEFSSTVQNLTSAQLNTRTSSLPRLVYLFVANSLYLLTRSIRPGQLRKIYIYSRIVPLCNLFYDALPEIRLWKERCGHAKDVLLTTSIRSRLREQSSINQHWDIYIAMLRLFRLRIDHSLLNNYSYTLSRNSFDLVKSRLMDLKGASRGLVLVNPICYTYPSFDKEVWLSILVLLSEMDLCVLVNTKSFGKAEDFAKESLHSNIHFINLDPFELLCSGRVVDLVITRPSGALVCTHSHNIKGLNNKPCLVLSSTEINGSAYASELDHDSLKRHLENMLLTRDQTPRILLLNSWRTFLAHDRLNMAEAVEEMFAGF